MSEIKLSRDEVQAKLADWLLAMGCPPEKVPTVDNISQMCRGTYYLIWRSLMEQVESKEIIKQKRLQVFTDDVRRCKKKNLFTEHDTNVLIPPELTLWRQQTEATQKVLEAEKRVSEARRDLNEIMDKVSSKMAQRNLARQRVQDLQRRGWLLQLLAEDLRGKTKSLAETRSIAEDMCDIQENTDVQPKLDKYLSSLSPLRRQPPAVASSTMIANSTGSANAEVDEELITQLIQCRGDALWAELYARRAALVASLSSKGEPTIDNNRPSFQMVLSRTAALQCTLALEALKCREMTRLAQQRLALAVDALNSQLSSEACELLVLRCERARSSARVTALRGLHHDVAARAGLFAAARVTALRGLHHDVAARAGLFAAARVTALRGLHHDVAARAGLFAAARVTALRGLHHDVAARAGLFAAARAAHAPPAASLQQVDKAIEAKKDEIKSVVSSLALTERKIQNVRECLAAIFGGFRGDALADVANGRGMQPELSAASIAALRQFYEQRRERRGTELSMEFDVSESSFSDLSDLSNVRFIDELKIYLKKFNLEKNRKLVLESGDQIWISETLQASVGRLQSRLQAVDVSCALLCPTECPPHAVRRLAAAACRRQRLRGKGGERAELCSPRDINKYTDEEDQIIDKVKKRLDENLRSLQKTSKTVDQGKENLSLWSNNKFKNHISLQRTVDGKPYRAYESYYLESLSF